MAIQFLDMRIAQTSTSDLPGLPLAAGAAPYTFGDIGLQTVQAAPGNTGLVRVTLNAFVRMAVGPSTGMGTDDVILSIYRNGTLIFASSYPGDLTAAGTAYELAGVTAVDYPPAAAVLGGQIQYTAVLTTFRNVTLGARSFSGFAVAGTN
ncbi:hypothetical protein [Paenibacillus tengchongensis]|uniref:hypothetical protein n=1 Tax=Paenibacillus tengchongensis TaxID=2608684 RepID=UPI00124C1F70|nr:hypothetical protein [Paenibacillus tengchongensis]